MFRPMCAQSPKISYLPFPLADVDLHFAGDASCFVDEKTAQAIGIISGEWVSNAVKYAHPAGVSGRIDPYEQQVSGRKH